MSAEATVADLYERHREVFERAVRAVRERHAWSPYPELPAAYPDAVRAQAEGAAAFRAHLGSRFALNQPGTVGEIGEEVSPYTQEPLGIRYPLADVDALFDAAEAAIGTWSQAPVDTRIGVLMEALDLLYREHLFEIANAVMHTAGQSFNMAYAGSGVNALDRGIEALVHAKQAMDQVPATARWERGFGSVRIALDKRYRLVPRGVAVCFSCASFPSWNAWPSMLASLATGNAVILKPHPATVLPMAISVRVFRRVLEDSGFDPNLVTMALDSAAEPIGKRLVRHPKTAIVDFTGSVAFGQWVERNAHPAVVFTETAGCNTVVLESADDLDAVLRSLATTLCLFSAQMCTSPQNIYVPAAGVRTPERLVPFDEVARRLADAVAALTGDPKKAAMILAALQSPATLGLLDELEREGERRGEVLLRPAPYAHPQFPAARTRTPLMLALRSTDRDLYGGERFGPVSFVIACEDANDALAQAARDVHEFGGLTAFLYSTDPDFVARAEAAYARAGAQLTINLTGPMPLNFSATYSDYHVTGLDPAGNASLTDAAFVASRFRIVQSRRPAAHEPTHPPEETPLGHNDIPVLNGGFAPIEGERVFDLTDIEGEVPKDLTGMHVRNGPNRRFEAPGRYHWFDGDGMLHAVRFEGGRVQYRNRWVMTESLQEELAAGSALWQGIKDPPRRDRPDMPIKNTSNTDVKFYAGNLISMWYLGGSVYRCNPDDLSTVGKLEFDPRMHGLPVSAHSKVDERTGEFLFFFAYGKESPYMHYGVMDRHGALQTFMPVQLPGPRLPHDMAITPNYTVVHDLPLFYDMDAFAAGRHKLKFHHTLPSRFGVIPRHGRPDQIRWFEASPTYMYHVSNAWEEDDGHGGTEIVMTGTPFRLPRDWRGNVEVDRFPKMLANLEHDFMFYEWRFNLRTGQTRERVLDDIVNQEFPVINSWMQGYKTRYSWNVLMGRSNRAEDPRFCGFVRQDLERGISTSYHEGVHKWFSEAPFAPKDNWQKEDDGYLVGFMWDDERKASFVTVFDAADVAQGPVARIRLPERVPNGFHATWVSGERLARGW